MKPEKPVTPGSRKPVSRREAMATGLSGAALLAAPLVSAQTTQYKTPGVYVVEENAFPNSVVEVATAVPAFIGYTERAERGGQDLRGRPVRLSSMREFEQVFGGAPAPVFGLIERPAAPTAQSLAEAEGADSAAMRMPFEVPGRSDGPFDLSRIDTPYLLHDAMALFFQNGGGDCTVVSVGGHEDRVDAATLGAALTLLEKEPEPALLVIPDAVRLSRAKAAALQQDMLRHCGEVMRSRVAILDIHGGYLPLDHPAGDPVAAFRNEIGATGLSYGAAYYPWLETTLHADTDFTFESMTAFTRAVVAEQVKADQGEDSEAYKTARRIVDPASDASAASTKKLDGALRLISPLYLRLTKGMARIANRQPPSAMMAGAYALTDNQIGVWKAPANLSLASVAAPMAPVSEEQQEGLDVPVSGLAVNAIRSFTGRGVLVWGARTLDGNSQDWRYVNVRRTVIMIEQSIMLAARAYVFEPNDSNTWATVRSMIENFLTNVWKAGGLAGATPAEAFSVDVGLGSTMTPVDVLEGRMRVTAKIAVARPAEFIVLTFEQQMQKS